MKQFLVIILFALLSLSCERLNDYFHSRETINLPPGKKLVHVSWKSGDLYYLIREMRPEEVPETYTFSKEGNFENLDNTYLIIECR